ncbi:MAG TPA: carboxypeptidase regulatory-like domain-containing protein, partial [Terracidiphilus sp.]
MKTKSVGIYLSPPDTARSSIQQRGFFVKRLIAIVCYLFLFQFFTLTYLTAQSYQSSGVVHDGTGALIPGAPVTVRQPEVPLELSSQTDDQGVFHLALPAAGTYQLEIGASGFKVYRAQIIVTADAPSLNLDIALAIEGNSQTVEVTADALAAETTSTQLGESLDTEKIQAVPLNGRSFTDLMAVQPGIVPQNTAQPGAVIMTGVASTPPSGDANPGNLSISGQRESSNGFRVNGSDVEEDVNMGTSILPNLDAIDSFRVLTSNFDAEYGNSSGGQILVITKAGKTQMHGSAFEFLRNTSLDARNYFSRDRAAYRQNQFGSTLGGAPFRTKNLALFADYQGTRLTEGIDTGNIAVPTLAERGGDFSQSPLIGSVNGDHWAAVLSSRLGRTVTAGEPYAQVFPAGQIPQSAWSNPAKNLIAYVPQPNAGEALFATSAEAQTLTDNKGALRADWTRGRGTLTAYYFLDDYALNNPYPTGTGGANVPGFDANSNGRAQLASVAHTITFGASTLNEFHLSFMRNANVVGQPHGGVGPSLASQGFSGIIPLKPSTEGIETVAFNDFTLGVDTTALVQAENIYEISDAFSHIVGKHGLKFGAELHANQINTHPDVVFNGSFSFNGSETGLDFADFLLGAPSSYTQGQARDFYNRNLYIAAFAQDSWKPLTQLTLNYGVRWDRIRPW